MHILQLPLQYKPAVPVQLIAHVGLRCRACVTCKRAACSMQVGKQGGAVLHDHNCAQVRKLKHMLTICAAASAAAGAGVLLACWQQMAWPYMCARLLQSPRKCVFADIAAQCANTNLQQPSMLCEPCATLHQHGHTERTTCASAAACDSLAAPMSALSSHGKCAAAAQPPQPYTACSNAHVAARPCTTAASMPPSRQIRRYVAKPVRCLCCYAHNMPAPR